MQRAVSEAVTRKRCKTTAECTVVLPDDVLTIIGSFLSWDDAYASAYRMVCRSIKFGIDLTAREIARHAPNRLYMMFGRNPYHFGPTNTIPICVRNITVPKLIDGSWRNLMRQVFGCCDACGSSSRWMLGCKEMGCSEVSCLTCVESRGRGKTYRCCDEWYCAKHARAKRCKGCFMQYCSSCIHPAEGRRNMPKSVDLCITCTNWDSDCD